MIVQHTPATPAMTTAAATRSPYTPATSSTPSEPTCAGDEVQLSAPTAVAAPAVAAEPPPAAGPTLTQRMTLGGLVALSMMGGFLAQPAAAAQGAVPPPPISATATRSVKVVTTNPDVVASTRTYINDMLDNNRVQSQNTNTYQKAFSNNYNTLVRIERRILDNPSSLANPSVRRVYEKVQAALDSAQVYSDVQEDILYQAGNAQTMQLPDGTVITVPAAPVTRIPRVTSDYQGATAVTDHAIEQVQDIMRGGR